VALLSFAPLIFAEPAHAVRVPATITCSDSSGNFNSWSVQWDNENQYFWDKGDIAAHFCEGGHAGSFNIFISVFGPDGSELDISLRYFNGVAPEPEPPAEPTETTEDVERATEDTERLTEDTERLTEDTERLTEDTERLTEDTERISEEVIRQPETTEVERPTQESAPQPEQPAPAPLEPVIPQPEPPIVEPEPEPTPVAPVAPVEPVKPPVKESVQPEPTEPSVPPTEPEISSEEPVLPEPEQPQGVGETFEAIGAAISESFDSAVAAVGQAIEAFQTAGLDMTEEERKTAQSVVIPSVIVAQIATLTFRK